jgi:hypothetical protein
LLHQGSCARFSVASGRAAPGRVRNASGTEDRRLGSRRHTVRP